MLCYSKPCLNTGTHVGGEESAFYAQVGKSDIERPFERWEDNIKKDSKYEGDRGLGLCDSE
jgi:hypothetical protein